MARDWIVGPQPCPTCSGSGKCSNNCSSGKVDSGAVDTSGKAIMINCSTCSGSGNCTNNCNNGTVMTGHWEGSN